MDWEYNLIPVALRPQTTRDRWEAATFVASRREFWRYEQDQQRLWVILLVVLKSFKSVFEASRASDQSFSWFP